MAWSRQVLNSSFRNSMNRAAPSDSYGGVTRGADLGMTGAGPALRGQASAPSGRLPDRTRARALAAAAVAEQLTNSGIAASELRAMNDGRTGRGSDDDTLVALLIARPEIKSLTELTGKDVAIDARDAASGARLRSALATAGARDVHVSSGAARPVDRLAQGEVPAAVLTLASSDIAELIPDIAGFTLFKLPLSPRSLEGRAASPAVR
jgi:hypothetical protein